MNAKETFKVYLVNIQTCGAMAGCGEGTTKEDAIADALRKALQMDPNAYYANGQVYFAGGMNR